MDKDTLLHAIDMKSQWQHTFGEASGNLRLYFERRERLFWDVLECLIEARYEQPTSRWLQSWAQIRKELPRNIARLLLLGLASKYEWYRGPVKGETLYMLQQAEAQAAGQAVTPTAQLKKINLYGAQAWLPDSGQQWYNKDGVWFERLSFEDSGRTRRIACGACFALIEFVNEVQVQSVLFHCVHEQRNLAAIWTLAHCEQTPVRATLFKWSQRTKHERTRVFVLKNFADLARERGMSTEEFCDTCVDTHGLDQQGICNWPFGEYRVHVMLGGGGRVQRRFYDAQEQRVAEIPLDVQQAYAPEWMAIQDELQSLTETLSLHKKRLQEALYQQRAWSYRSWQLCFAAHPVMGYLARRLIWHVQPADTPLTFYVLPMPEHRWCDMHGQMLTLTPESQFTLARPSEIDPDERTQWQRLLTQRKLAQPFKQLASRL